MVAHERKRRPSQISAGILAYRRGHELEVLLAHPGGPFWAKKDAGEIESGADIAGKVSRYARIIEAVFQRYWKEGKSEFSFERDE